MLLPAAALRDEAWGVRAAWGDGAYSDDLNLAALASQRGSRVLCPAEAVFPAQLEAGWTATRWWNYLHRQLFVLDTYMTPHNRAVNHSYLAAQLWASTALSAAAALSAAHLSAALVRLTGHAAPSCLGCGSGLLLSAAFVALLLAALAAARAMYAAVLDLCAELSPGWRRQRRAVRINWALLGAAVLFSNSLLPLCALRMLLGSRVDWAGITYAKQWGRVVRVTAAAAAASSTTRGEAGDRRWKTNTENLP